MRDKGSKGRKWKPLPTQATLTRQLLSEAKVSLAFVREAVLPASPASVSLPLITESLFLLENQPSTTLSQLWGF